MKLRPPTHRIKGQKNTDTIQQGFAWIIRSNWLKLLQPTKNAIYFMVCSTQKKTIYLVHQFHKSIKQSWCPKTIKTKLI